MNKTEQDMRRGVTETLVFIREYCKDYNLSLQLAPAILSFAAEEIRLIESSMIFEGKP